MISCFLTFVLSLIDCLFILICYQRIFNFLWAQYLECFLIYLKCKTLRWEQGTFLASPMLPLLPSVIPFTLGGHQGAAQSPLPI